jgi:uncharacterized phage protein (TIGR01671 family)
MIYDAESNYHWTGYLFYKKHYELMQYTGLLDKNGKDIYEGDYVTMAIETDLGGSPEQPHTEIDEFKGVVVYKSEGCAFFLEDDDHGDMPMYSDFEIEIIGNIYETPELLK